jgi:hypothetical protein
MVVYTLYFTCDANLLLFGHSAIFLSDFTSRLRAALLARTPSTCLNLNFNPDQLQQSKAIQGIVLMLYNLFFPVAFINLVYNNADFDCSLLLAGGLTTYRRPGPGRPPPTSTPIGGNAAGHPRTLCWCCPFCSSRSC